MGMNASVHTAWEYRPGVTGVMGANASVHTAREYR